MWLGLPLLNKARLLTSWICKWNFEHKNRNLWSRWLKTASSSFQDRIWRVITTTISVTVDATIIIAEDYLIKCKNVTIGFVTQQVTIATVGPAKHPQFFNYWILISKFAIFFQSLKTLLYIGFRATLNFQNFKVIPNPSIYRTGFWEQNPLFQWLTIPSVIILKIRLPIQRL